MKSETRLIRGYGNDMRQKHVILVLLLSSILITIIHTTGKAQIAEEIWSEPINLSNSGAAGRSSATVDFQGVAHVLWNDRVAGLQYVRTVNNQWSSPRTLALPRFRQVLPTLVSTKGGYVHAFWINDENEMLYSRVVARYMDDIHSWSSPTRLDQGVVKFDVHVSDDNYIHLGYVLASNRVNIPAGIYYRRSSDEGARWWKPTQLYESSYIRSIDTEDANVKVTTASKAEFHYVYVVWDNSIRKQVFFSRSADNGGNFDNPLLIDNPDLETNSINPFHIQVGAKENLVVLVWQNGDATATCNQLYMASNDAAVTWHNRQVMLDEISGCAKSNDFVEINRPQLILQSIINSQAYFIAFNGEQWSEPQFQSGISTFADPATFTTVNFSCHQLFPHQELSILAIGCDAGGGLDIWATSRILTSTDSWFLPSSLWSLPTTVYTSTLPIDELTIANGFSGKVHAFWSGEEPGTDRRVVRLIEYTRLENGIWSAARPVLRSPNGNADQPSVILDTMDHLLVGWTGGVSGEIYFNNVVSSQAFASNRWVNSIKIPAVRDAGNYPNIAIDESGTIYYAYLIPINENRGVYLSRSNDGGETWDEPSQVFSGVAANWELLANLNLGRTEDGVLHLIWTKNSLQAGIGVLELVYARSNDSGITWSEPQIISNSPILWSKVVGVGLNNVHILWQKDSPVEPESEHAFSHDSGMTWERSSSLSSSGDIPGAIDILSDPVGEVHLLRLVRDPSNRAVHLQRFQWRNGSWNIQDNVQLEIESSADISELASGINPIGRLDVLYKFRIPETATSGETYKINYVYRPLDLDGPILTPVPTTIPAPILTTTSTITTINTATPPPRLQNPVDPISGMSDLVSQGGLIIGVSLSVFVVIFVFARWIAIRRSI